MRVLALLIGLVLATLAASTAVAQNAATVVFVERNGKVCVGGSAVIWTTEDGKVRRWQQADGAVGEVHLPNLGHGHMARGDILGCRIHPTGEMDIYYEEYFNIPGTSPDIGWDANRRVQTVWFSGSRHRELLTIKVPEGGDKAPTYRGFGR